MRMSLRPKSRWKGFWNGFRGSGVDANMVFVLPIRGSIGREIIAARGAMLPFPTIDRRVSGSRLRINTYTWSVELDENDTEAVTGSARLHKLRKQCRGTRRWICGPGNVRWI
jgi:hypothetical protein